MNCMKCGGRVFYDSTETNRHAFELFCLLCAKRWTVRRDSKPFARWLEARVDAQQTVLPR